MEDAEYYHFYYKENSESNFWHDVDEQTGEKIKMFYDEEYTTKYWGLEQGKKYNIIVTSVKNGIESNDSEIFTFEFNPGSNMDILRNAIKQNTTPVNGYLYKISTDKIREGNLSHYTALVYDEKGDEIYIETVYDMANGDSVANLIYLDGPPERINKLKRVMYLYLADTAPSPKNTVGTADIDPTTFREGSNIVFHYYDSPTGNTVKKEDQELSTAFAKIGLSEANQVLAMYGVPLDMTDLGFVYFRAIQ